MSQPPEIARRTKWICLLLALATLGAYWGVFSADFVHYDDPYYVLQNAHVQTGFSGENLHWAFTSKDCGNWHPLTWMSHIMDCSLYGLNPTGHHVTNLVIHILNSILLFLLLQRMTGAQWRSAFVAALFALHPLHVESVAWVAERKDVLSTFFWILAIWAYTRYAERPQAGGYLLVLGLFALGLMAKPMVVTLPFLLLLLDFWPLCRLPDAVTLFGNETRIYASPVEHRYNVASPGRLLLEKVPLIVLSLVSSLVTTWAQAEAIATVIDFKFRFLNAALSYLRYLGKTFWPVHLYVNYPYPRGWSVWFPIVAILIVSCLSIIAFKQAKRRPWFFTGWFWFLGTLVPVIGLVQAGVQSMADRYTYVPLIGIFIVLSWGGYELVKDWPGRSSALFAPPAVVLICCLALTVVQVRYWKDSLVLFQHALNLNPDNFMAEHNLGVSYAETGELELAYDHLVKAARINPTYGETYNNIGQVEIRLGKYENAVETFQTALEYHGPAAGAYYGLAVAFEKQGKLKEASENCAEVIKRLPELWDPHDEFGIILQKEGKPGEALEEFQKARQLQPKNPLPYLHAANVLNQLGQTSDAIKYYQEALSLDPDLIEALNDLAWILASNPDSTIRNGEGALRLARHACELTHFQKPLLLGTLGAAYAETGQFSDAVAMAEKAAALAASLGRNELAQKNRELAQLFRSHKAFYEARPQGQANPPPAGVPQ